MKKIKLEARPENLEISALTFSKICSPLSMKLDVEAHTHLHGLHLADSSPTKDVPTNIIIISMLSRMKFVEAKEVQ